MNDIETVIASGQGVTREEARELGVFDEDAVSVTDAVEAGQDEAWTPAEALAGAMRRA